MPTAWCTIDTLFCSMLFWGPVWVYCRHLALASQLTLESWFISPRGGGRSVLSHGGHCHTWLLSSLLHSQGYSQLNRNQHSSISTCLTIRPFKIHSTQAYCSDSCFGKVSSSAKRVPVEDVWLLWSSFCAKTASKFTFSVPLPAVPWGGYSARNLLLITSFAHIEQHILTLQMPPLNSFHLFLYLHNNERMWYL